MYKGGAKGKEAHNAEATEKTMNAATTKNMKDGTKATVIGCIKIDKVCDFDGKRWMWVDLQGFKLKVTQGTCLAKWLDAKWVTNVGKKTGGTVTAQPVGFVGTAKALPVGGLTLVDRKLLDLEKFGIFTDEECDAEEFIAKADKNVGLEID